MITLHATTQVSAEVTINDPHPRVAETWIVGNDQTIKFTISGDTIDVTECTIRIVKRTNLSVEYYSFSYKIPVEVQGVNIKNITVPSVGQPPGGAMACFVRIQITRPTGPESSEDVELTIQEGFGGDEG